MTRSEHSAVPTDVSHPCPLCGGAGRVVERFDGSALVEIYRRSLAIDVASEVERRPISFIECADCGLGHFSPMRGGSPEFYESLQRYHWYYQAERPEFDFVRRFVRPDDRVLEVGAGAGSFAASLKCHNYVGLEFNERAIAAAKAKGVHLLREDLASHAGRSPGAYDVACAFQVLEHVERPHDFLQSLQRAVAPGGHVIVSVPAADSFLGVQTNGALNLPPHHLTWWRDRTFEALEARLGLRLVRLEKHALEEIHLANFAGSLVALALGSGGRVIDLGIGARARAWATARLAPPLARLLRPAQPWMRGETMTAVLAV